MLLSQFGLEFGNVVISQELSHNSTKYGSPLPQLSASQLLLANICLHPTWTCTQHWYTAHNLPLLPRMQMIWRVENGSLSPT